MEIAVAPARARAEGEDVAALVADDEVGAEIADQAAMSANALADLAAQAEAADRIELDEAAGLDREADIAHRRADIVLLAFCPDGDRRAEIEALLPWPRTPKPMPSSCA